MEIFIHFFETVFLYTFLELYVSCVSLCFVYVLPPPPPLPSLYPTTFFIFYLSYHKRIARPDPFFCNHIPFHHSCLLLVSTLFFKIRWLFEPLYVIYVVYTFTLPPRSVLVFLLE